VGGVFQYDVTQPMGPSTPLAVTKVTRTCIGDPGITYKYLGLRMFAHPWTDDQAPTDSDDRAVQPTPPLPLYPPHAHPPSPELAVRCVWWWRVCVWVQVSGAYRCLRAQNEALDARSQRRLAAEGKGGAHTTHRGSQKLVPEPISHKPAGPCQPAVCSLSTDNMWTVSLFRCI